MPSPPSGYRLPDKKRGNNQEGVHLNPVSTGSGVIPPEMVFRCYIGPLQPCVLYTVKEMQFPYVQSPSQKEVTGENAFASTWVSPVLYHNHKIKARIEDDVAISIASSTWSG